MRSRVGLALQLGLLIGLPSASPAAPLGVTALAGPVSFERNVGQAPPDVLYQARSGGVRIALGRDGFRLEAGGETLGLRFAGGRPAVVEGVRELPGRSHEFLGPDPRRWHVGIPRFGRVRYRRVYSGTDVEVYGAARGFEYDFVLAPGADPSAVRLAVRGAAAVEIDGDGALVLETGGGRLVQPPPAAYQETRSGRRSVACRYTMRAGTVGFDLGTYDRHLTLVIDPVLAFSTYLGGPYEDQPGAMARVADGSVVIAGWDGFDAVLNRIAATGELAWSARLGGSDFDAAQDVAIDAQGNVYVTGVTTSADFPVVAALQPARSGGGDAFVTKLTPDGQGLVFSTFLGGSGAERGNGIGVDTAGGAVVAGFTTSPDFPVTPGAAQRALAGGADVFVARLSPSGAQLVFATYLGGSGDDGYNFDQSNVVAVDGSGSAWVTGSTTSTDFPTTPGAFQRSHRGGYFDAFVARFTPTGGLQWSTYLGGSQHDAAYGIAAGADATAYVVGVTLSTDFPVTPGALDTVSECCLGEGFLVRVAPDGSHLVFGTFVGGTSSTAYGVDVDALGRAYVAGETYGGDLPLVDPVQASCSSCVAGYPDAVAMIVDPSGSALLFSTYLGGAGYDRGNAAAADGGGTFWVTGEAGPGFPVTPGALQPSYGGGTSDGFLVRLTSDTTQLVMDVTGYFGPAGDFFALTPCRLVDTRLPAGPRGGPALAAGADRTFPVAGTCGLPPFPAAIAVNLTVVSPVGAGHLRVFPSGTSLPPTSAINYGAGQTRGNNAVVPVGPEGITVRCVQGPPP